MDEEASGRDYYDQVESMTNKTDRPTSPMLAACRWGTLDVIPESGASRRCTKPPRADESLAKCIAHDKLYM